jgi:hypothetical protein
VDDEQRLGAYGRMLESAAAGHLGEADRRLLTGLHFALVHKVTDVGSLGDSLAVLHAHPAVVSELRELLPILDERAAHLTYPLDAEVGWQHQVPLSVHGQYATDEVLTAFGLLDIGAPAWKQVGIFRDEVTNSEMFLVTLEKSERDYSPSTRYQDYAISQTDFHWESQSTQTQAGKAGQRYIRHRELGGHIFLFVRQRKKDGARTMPYTFLGPADYVSHQQERPIQFVWRLRRPMPADFFREAKVVGG